MTSSDGVRVEKLGAALVLTIDRPFSGNAVDLPTAEALRGALTTSDDPDLRAIIITGAGDRFFCAGGDLKAYQLIETPDILESTFGAVRKLLDALEECPLPVLAAINGYALGGGMELALACDLRFATRTAVIGLPQTKLGIIPGWNGVERLVETVGRSKAINLLLKGERLDATRAEHIGLVDVVVEGPVLRAALDYTDSLQEGAPLAVRACKRAVLSALRLPRRESRVLTSAILEQLWFSEDHREAERAFIEKRKPHFRGK
jgi:enoyl-CoA hydratase